MKIAGIVLAGGQSKRMGQDKSMLKIQNKTLLQHTSDILSKSGIEDIYTSGGEDGIQDKHPDKGPVGGILSSLLALNEHTHLLFLPVDMPLITQLIIQELMNIRKNDLQHFENNNFPLIIKNNRSTREALEDQIKNNKLSIHELLQAVNTKILILNHKQELFMNTNTPQQWEMATRRLLELQP